MAKPRFFRKINSEDRELQQVQFNIEQAVAPFIKSPILNGRLETSINLTSGDNKIEHKLGRKIIGYIIVSQSASIDIYDNIPTSTDGEKYLTLNSSANAVISAWFF